MADLKTCIYQTVAGIPEGRVMTYGQVAAFCAHPRAARVVGQVAHFGPVDLPWHRVVNRHGGLARGYTGGGRELHKEHLEAEGIQVRNDYTVDIDNLIWRPSFAKATEGSPSIAKATRDKSYSAKTTEDAADE